MKLSEIETADLPVKEMTITHYQITILYDEVYHIPTQSYIKNIQITITNWLELLVKIFLSPAPYIKPTEVICEGAQREVFDLIQEITFLDNTLILKGISKENKYWMEYYITDSQWVLL
ncbi:hypothetical protein HMPREF1551_02632 [Capnocytophaga sp. oral taxon 863 str. F0517]|uniref:hypothetical protein n=1 Tax=Capnocytophaga sp. oral taxon 863 TaxID=1227265 RepID=UPI0003970106|nr:hypothetical protein [Capnocytophaga sp. oral taxon 863]ERI61492.1 hypothetical protein HMPREF1551_02632 [Capnocytophaga sp. oral taxon 863 str. F0517]